MAKNINQKKKLLTILNILNTKTDENHKLNTTDLINELLKYDISAERKSIYDDVDTLNDMGYDILLDKSKNGGYYVASRPIEKHEMVLLVDAISSSKFITLKKSRELIKKLESLLSIYEAKELDREIYVNNRIKQDNESIYYVVDDIHNAIYLKNNISFKYCEWNASKQLVPRHNGKSYNVKPLSLAWDDEKYYLIGVDNDINEIRHYRVDKIKDLCVIDKSIDKDVVKSSQILENNKFKSFDIASYSNKIFGMYGGELTYVDLAYKENMIGVIIDRFGKDVNVIKDFNDNSILHSRVEVSVSSQFFGWIAGTEGAVTIAGPEAAKEQYRQFLTKLIESYY